MSFWSGETLAKRLPTLIAPYDPNRIDGAAYTLALGAEVYVTSDHRLEGNPQAGVKTELDPGSQFRIPPGQFSFLLTEEEVSVPDDAIALISIRATYKFKGLVNVSGFHVDPGWRGRLIFSVHNAGPASVVLSRGAPAFLIWYVSLDQSTKYVKNGAARFEKLPDGLLNNIGGNVFSPMILSQEITELRQSDSDLREELSERAHNLRIELASLKSDYEFHKKFFWVIIVGALLLAARPFVTSMLEAALRESKPEVHGPVDSSPKAPSSSDIQGRRPPLPAPASAAKSKKDEDKKAVPSELPNN